MRSSNLLVDGRAKPLTINCVLCVKKEAEPLVLHLRLTSYHNILEAVKEHPPAELLSRRGPCHRL